MESFEILTIFPIPLASERQTASYVRSLGDIWIHKSKLEALSPDPVAGERDEVQS